MQTRLDPLAAPHPASATWVGLALGLWWLLCFVDSAWPQMQMALLGNYVLFGMWPLHLLYLMLGSYLVLRTGVPEVPKALLWWWATFGAYLFVSLFFLEARFANSLGELVTTFYRFYFYVATLPLAFALRGTLDSVRMQKILLVLFVPLAALGLRQHFAADPILPTVAVNGTFQVYAWWFQGDIRAFSLFNSGWSFGHFAAFIAVIALWRWLFRQPGSQQSWLMPAFFVAAMACVYFCLTRTVYLVALAGIFATFWLARSRQNDRFVAAHWLPALFALGGFMVARGIKDLMGFLGLGNDGIFNSGSLDYRQEAWAIWTDVWLNQGVANALFGAAVTQKDSGQLYGESTVLIDNVFIAIGVQVGIVGMLIWIGLMWVLWSFMLREARERDEPLMWAIAAIWSTWPLSLMFGSGGNYYLLLLILAVLTGPRTSLFAGEADEAPAFEVPQQRLRDNAVARVAQVGVVRHEQVARPFAQRFIEGQIDPRQPQ